MPNKIPRKCLTRTLSLSLSRYSFLSQHSSMVVSRLNRCSIPKIGKGRSGFALRTGEIQYFSFPGALTNLNLFLAPQLYNCWFTPNSIIRSDNPLVDQYACCGSYGKVVTRPRVSYLPELKLVIALLPRMTITGSHLYIWMERGFVKENCLSQDDMAMP